LVALLASTHAVPKPEIAKLNGKVKKSTCLFGIYPFPLSFRIFISVHILFVSDFPHLFSVILWHSAHFLCHSLSFRTFSLSFSGFPNLFSVILWFSAPFLCHSLTFRNFFVILWLSAPFPCRSLAFVIIVLSSFVSVLPFICLFV
jgi:hypothetical protein